MFPSLPIGRPVVLGYLLAAVSRAGLAADIEAPPAIGVVTNTVRPLVALDRLTFPVLAPATKEGEARIKQFKLSPGLKVGLWAAEPMLANPVAFSVDELGRVFTSETYRYRSSVLDIRHYMFMLENDLANRTLEDRMAQIRRHFGAEGVGELSQETEVLRMLEDRDHDGRADTSTIVADGFTGPLDGIASGVLARRGQLWFTDIPSVWRFSPSNTPAAAQSLPAPSEAVLISRPTVHLPGYRAEEIARGFGVRFSFTGHDLHGLKFGPDGRLYFSVGDRGTHLTTKEGGIIELPDEGAVFRCEPDGANLEVVHRGLRNPQELAFNEYGDLFTGDNDSDQGDRERWVQVIEGADSGWRVGHQHAPLGNAGMWNLERLWVPHFTGQAAYILPPVANIGDGPSGLVHDYGTSLPERLGNRFLLAYFKGTSAKSGIYSLVVLPSGASYDLTAHDEFLWNALVPDVDLGPDGAVWFADWHEGWPKSNKGRLYRAWFPEVLADPVVKETARLLAEGMSKRPEVELLTLLAHRDQRVRQEAQFELAERGPKSAAPLSAVAASPRATELSRLHALWGLGQICRAPAGRRVVAELVPLLPNLADPSAEIRAQTAALLGEMRLQNAQTPLLKLFRDPSPRVRRQAVIAVSRFWLPGYKGDPGVRLAPGSAGRVAAALAKTGLPAAVNPAFEFVEETEPPHEALFALARTNAEPLIQHEIVRFLARIGLGATAVAEGKFAASPEEAARLQMVGLLALRQGADADVTNLLGASNPLLLLEAARAINDVPIPAALPALAALAQPARLDALLRQFAALPVGNSTAASVLSPGAIRDVRADQPLPWADAPIDHLTPMLLRVVNANFRLGTAESAQRLAALAARKELPALIRIEALYALSTWAEPAARDRIVGTYRPLARRDPKPGAVALGGILTPMLTFPGSDESLLIAAAEGVARLHLPAAITPLRVLVENTAAPAAARAAALRSFAQISAEKSQLESLLALAARDSAEALRLEASKLSAALNPNDAAGQLANLLKTGTTAEQQAAYATLGDLKNDAADALLAEALDRLMKREIAPEVTLELVEAAAKRSAGAVTNRLAAYQDWKLPKDHLSPYREALVGGDAARGRKIFYENTAVACTRCHQIGGDGGGNAGPKLDGVASRNGREHLLESIVFPNQQITPSFEAALITRRNGEVIAGTLKRETDTTIVLINSEDGGEVPILKADISAREKGPSGMPEGFGNLLTRTELRDVLEFLGSLR